jgi:dissimilatory sulfite reductase (desulfoviridin) alpha/beta subunit
LEKEDLPDFLRQCIPGDIKFHHEFKVTLAECPNACSQPQIKDIGIIGAVVPTATKEECTLCEACVEACKDKCITIDNTSKMPEIDFECCLKCGQCIRACPSGTIGEGRKGFRVQLGGKLGRHPKLATELEGIYSEDEVLQIVKRCIEFYKGNSKHGERFAEIFENADFLKDLLHLNSYENELS